MRRSAGPFDEPLNECQGGHVFCRDLMTLGAQQHAEGIRVANKAFGLKVFKNHGKRWAMQTPVAKAQYSRAASDLSEQGFQKRKECIRTLNKKKKAIYACHSTNSDPC